MAEHEKLPWSAINGGVDIVDNARCSLIANVWAQGENRGGPIAQANAAFIVKAVNWHKALLKALADILEANKDFRDDLPQNWDGDPLQDACDEAAKLLVHVGRAP